jgi:radical SAM-linked protein
LQAEVLFLQAAQANWPALPVKAEMSFHQPQAATTAPCKTLTEPIRDKVRIRFGKGGDLRLVSHHDLMQCFERMLRRAQLPFHSTQGFNPKPRMAFALSLALGVTGLEEVLELELEALLPVEEIHARLVSQAPAGLIILSIRRVERSTRAQVRRACYRLPIPAERRVGLPARLAELLAATHCHVERYRQRRLGWDNDSDSDAQVTPAADPSGSDTLHAPRATHHAPRATHDTPRTLDIRPYLRDLRLVDGALELDFWVTPTGTARPEEVLALLHMGDLLEAGAVLERCTLELHDEVSATDLPPQTVENLSY